MKGRFGVHYIWGPFGYVWGPFICLGTHLELILFRATWALWLLDAIPFYFGGYRYQSNSSLITPTPTTALLRPTTMIIVVAPKACCFMMTTADKKDKVKVGQLPANRATRAR